VSNRVLVVEDNDDVAKAIDVMLGVARFQHRTVRSAEDALALLDAGERFDIVLTDLMLGPGLSGLELATAIRERWPGLPVVLMTGYSDAIAAGAADGVTMLAKPFGPRTLRASLEQAQAAARRADSGT
jgi:DNA-binding NtrC family response regulator